MTRDEIEAVVSTELQNRKTSVLNRNAWDALFATVPAGSLIQLFRGRSRAVDDEKQKITLEVVIDLLLGIDAAISAAKSEAVAKGISIAGFIEARGTNAEEVTGAKIKSTARNVEIQSGTHIRADGENVRRITGLEIGGE